MDQSSFEFVRLLTNPWVLTTALSWNSTGKIGRIGPQNLMLKWRCVSARCVRFSLWNSSFRPLRRSRVPGCPETQFSLTEISLKVPLWPKFNAISTIISIASYVIYRHWTKLACITFTVSKTLMWGKTNEACHANLSNKKNLLWYKLLCQWEILSTAQP